MEINQWALQFAYEDWVSGYQRGAEDAAANKAHFDFQLSKFYSPSLAIIENGYWDGHKDYRTKKEMKFGGFDNPNENDQIVIEHVRLLLNKEIARRKEMT